MASCLSELHFWSLKNQYAIPDEELGCHSYHDKGEIVNRSEHPYYQEKQNYVEGRDITWTPRNKRPERLRDTIKEMEDLLAQYNVIQIRWRNRQILQLVLNNASIITLIISGHCGDIERIYIDKSLVGKLSAERICDAYLTDQFFIASHANMNRLDYAYYTKRPPLSEAAKRLDRLATWEPKVTQLDIPGPKGRRLDRSFSMNTAQDMLLVWWSIESGEAWPWSPMTSERDRANIIVISISGPSIDVLAHTRTECDPLHAQFSCLQPHRIFTLEQQIARQDEVIGRCCIYEIIRGQIQTASIVNIPLKSTIVCQARNSTEDRLILGLSDASLVMYDDLRKITQFTRAAMPPASMVWHPNGALLIVASARADIQIYDRALSPLQIQLISEEPSPERFLRISKFFRTSVTLKEMEWCPFPPHSSEFMTSYTDALFLSFSRGPVALMQFHLGVRSQERFSCLELVKEYIKHKQVDETVTLLGSMNWDTEGQSCYACLSAIVNHLLRQPLNPDREAQLQASLATFYAPKPAISEATILEYRDPISQLARRFFHHLLRYVRFDKAFLLAVDIGARDLFMDIHYMAADKGETALAVVAKRKAEQIESDGLDTMQEFDDDPILLNQTSILHQHQDWGNNHEALVAQLPSSRQHPWQHEMYTSHSSQDRDNVDLLTNPHLAGCIPNLGELHLQDHLIDDYTSALMAPDARNTHVEARHGASAVRSRDEDPAVEFHGEGNEEEEMREGEERGRGEARDAKNIKVIHFGIV